MAKNFNLLKLKHYLTETETEKESPEKKWVFSLRLIRE